MLATGGLLIALAALSLAALAPLFRRADPPRWTTYGWAGELVTLAIVCTLAMGLGYFGAGAIAAFETGPDFLDLGLLLLVLLVAVMLGRALRQRAGAQPAAAGPRVHAHVTAPATPAPRAAPAVASASAPPPHKAA